MPDRTADDCGCRRIRKRCKSRTCGRGTCQRDYRRQDASGRAGPERREQASRPRQLDATRSIASHSMSVFSIEVSAAVSLLERLELGTVDYYRQLAGVADGLVRDSDGFNNQILRYVTASIARSPASSD